jgi:hypothetical protein
MAINILLETLSCRTDEFACILALRDNTSVIGWLFRSAGLELDELAMEAHLMVLARKVAHIVLDNDSCLASLHLPGNLNTVVNLLSFAGSMTRSGGKKHPLEADGPPNDILTQRFHEAYLSVISGGTSQLLVFLRNPENRHTSRNPNYRPHKCSHIQITLF